MKKESRKLLVITIVAFITFLFVFAKVVYDYGYSVGWLRGSDSAGSLDGLWAAIFLPVFYFALVVVAVVLKHNPPIYKRPYIVMSIVSIGQIAIFWIVYSFSITNDTLDFVGEIWYPIVSSVLSLVMTACYVSIVVDIIKSDRKIKQSNEE